jgi:hypothetical protein
MARISVASSPGRGFSRDDFIGCCNTLLLDGARCRIPVIGEAWAHRFANSLNDMEEEFQSSRPTCSSQSAMLKISAELCVLKWH